MTETTNRESGFYWVRRGAEWVVAEWDEIGDGTFGWFVTGYECDVGAVEVDERRLERAT